jgi:hypothetical protein
MRCRTPNGFTLVETVISGFAGALVLLAMATVLGAGHVFWNRTYEKIAVQRDGSYATHSISRAVRRGSSAILENDGKAVRIYTVSNWIRYSLDADTESITCQIEGKAPQTVIENVQDVYFTKTGQTIGIDLTIKKDTFESRFVASAMMRNCGG